MIDDIAHLVFVPKTKLPTQAGLLPFFMAASLRSKTALGVKPAIAMVGQRPTVGS